MSWLENRKLNKSFQKVAQSFEEMKYGKEGAKLLPKTKKEGTKELSLETINKVSKQMKRKKFVDKWKRFFLPLILLLTGIIIVILVPVFYNYIISLPSKSAVGTVGDWVSFYGSYLGGLIGGLLTLLGVRLTIIDTSKKHYLDTYPDKEINLNEIITLLENIKKEVKNCNNYEEIVSLLTTFKDKNEKNIRKLAIKVSPTTYTVIKKYFENVPSNILLTHYYFENNDINVVVEEINKYITILKRIQNKLFDEYVNSSQIV